MSLQLGTYSDTGWLSLSISTIPLTAKQITSRFVKIWCIPNYMWYFNTYCFVIIHFEQFIHIIFILSRFSCREKEVFCLFFFNIGHLSTMRDSIKMPDSISLNLDECRLHTSIDILKLSLALSSEQLIHQTSAHSKD